MASDDEDGIFKVETVPPPEGESDVYNAPTKVGALAGSIVEEIVQQARRQAELTAQGRTSPSDSFEAGDDEPAVIDPMKLLAVEQLAAREEAALRPAGLAADVAHREEAQTIGSTPPTAAADEPPAPAALHDGDDAPPALARVGGALPPPPDPAAIVAPIAALAAPEPTAPPQPARRPPSRASTVMLLALVLVLLAFGIYRLKR